MNQDWIAKLQLTHRVRAKAQNDTLETKIYHALTFIYKLIAKVQEIKNDQNSTKSPQKHEKDFAGNLAAPSPHLNLTMSTLGAGEPPCQQNKKHKQIRQPKTKTKTPQKHTTQYAQR